MALILSFNYPQVAREAGFKIRKYNNGPMDWRILGSIEIDQLLDEQDLHKIDNILEHLCETPLGSILESNILEHSIAKYFLVSQFAIQYLLFCRTFLDETLTDLKEAHNEAQGEITNLRKSLYESNNEVVQLNKKINEIEKIREVVYPCHLCSKSFVSNESLNVHIGRKHPSSGDRSISSEKILDSPSIIQRERNNDLTLINTIKLELEIKQLKERLNVAEKDIKERSAFSSKRCTPRDYIKKNVKHVGIQNDLFEQKEQDECMIIEPSLAKIQGESLQQLANKVHEFEIWRDKLRADYDKFIVDINKKFELLAKTLEDSQSAENKSNGFVEKIPIASMQELENLLLKKVTEIGETSAKKLEEVVERMEESYKSKLFDLETEIKNRNSELLNKVKEIDSNTSIDKGVTNKISSNTFTIEKEEAISNQSISTTLHHNGNERIYNENNNSSTASSNALESVSELESASIEISQMVKNADKSFTENVDYQNRNCNIEAKVYRSSKKELKTKKHKKEIKYSNKNKQIHEFMPRNVAKKIANHELQKHGINLKTKAISKSRMKRIYVHLAERRSILKEQYPHIYEIRSRLKQFIDKLCSTQLPDKAEKIMNTMLALQPESNQHSLNEFLKPSNNQNEKPDLERLLVQSTVEENTCSKIILGKSQSSFDDCPSTSAAARLKLEEGLKFKNKAIPVPRKRVMFTTPSSRNNENLNVTDN